MEALSGTAAWCIWGAPLRPQLCGALNLARWELHVAGSRGAEQLQQAQPVHPGQLRRQLDHRLQTLVFQGRGNLRQLSPILTCFPDWGGTAYGSSGQRIEPTSVRVRRAQQGLVPKYPPRLYKDPPHPIFFELSG